MKKALFIDRDGTIIAEPADEQIDSLEKLAFVPGAISALKALTGLGFDLVLATNQDGLGTPSFPEDTFWPAHNKMLATLGGEGVAHRAALVGGAVVHKDALPVARAGLLDHAFDAGGQVVLHVVDRDDDGKERHKCLLAIKPSPEGEGGPKGRMRGECALQAVSG